MNPGRLQLTNLHITRICKYLLGRANRLEKERSRVPAGLSPWAQARGCCWRQWLGRWVWLCRWMDYRLMYYFLDSATQKWTGLMLYGGWESRVYILIASWCGDSLQHDPTCILILALALLHCVFYHTACPHLQRIQEYGRRESTNQPSSPVWSYSWV